MAFDYLAAVLASIPQILSNQDRDPLSPSYGCFDRKYWGWKYKDFPDATLQCALSPLVQIWDLDHPDNPYRGDPALFEWIAAGADFLLRIRHADGGFDQCYPYERAPGNAYELFESAALFLDKARGKIPDERLGVYRAALLKACEFTLTHDEDHGRIANHFALYAHASLAMGRFFGDERFTKKGESLLAKVLSLQSPEGWFLEYDGADPGYETRTLYYLAKIGTEFGREAALAAAAKSLNFLAACVHPDGSLGGEYGSRNTSLCYPAGFEILGSRFPEAAAIVRALRRGLETRRALSLDSLDPDNLARLAANYLEAHRAASDAGGDFRLPFERDAFDLDLPRAGLRVKTTPSYYFIANVKKGGGFRLYDKKTGVLVFADTSYGALTEGGDAITANLLDGAAPAPSQNGGTVAATARFHRVLQQNVTPLKMIALRIASLTFLRIGFVSRLFSRFVARVLFTGRKLLPYELKRSFTLANDSVHVEDVLPETAGLKEIYATSFSTSIHMASSKYFGRGDLPLLVRPRNVFRPSGQNGGLLIQTDLLYKDGIWTLRQEEKGQ